MTLMVYELPEENEDEDGMQFHGTDALEPTSSSDDCSAPAALSQRPYFHKWSCAAMYYDAWMVNGEAMQGFWTLDGVHSDEYIVQRFYECEDRWSWDVINISLSLDTYVEDVQACPRFKMASEELWRLTERFMSTGKALHLCVPKDVCAAKDMAEQVLPMWLQFEFFLGPLFQKLPTFRIGHHVNVTEFNFSKHRLEAHE